jgi:hypothetical protein
MSKKQATQDTVVLTGKQMVDLLDKYMYITRDFQSEFLKAPGNKILECWNFFEVCSKSESLVKTKFGIKTPKWFMVCVDSSYKVIYYTAKNQQKDKVRTKDIHVLNLTDVESKQVEKICTYKQQYNGRGEDPKCLSK